MRSSHVIESRIGKAPYVCSLIADGETLGVFELVGRIRDAWGCDEKTARLAIRKAAEAHRILQTQRGRWEMWGK